MLSIVRGVAMTSSRSSSPAPPEMCADCDTSASVTSDLHKYQVACTCKSSDVDGGQYAQCSEQVGVPTTDTPPALPPRPPRPGVGARQMRTRNATLASANGMGGSRLCGTSGQPRRKYAWWCAGCGALAALLGAMLAVAHALLRSYTASPHHLETVPAAVPAAMLVLTGLCIMSLARRRNRYSYMIKVVGACCLVCALTCVLVTITTTVIHMNKLQTLRECLYTQRSRTCTCYSVPLQHQPINQEQDEGLRCVFEGVSDCGVVHGALYWCLRAVFALSVSAVLVCIFSSMLAYQLLSHERKKMYWEQLELRCRSLYRPSTNAGTNTLRQQAMQVAAAGCTCCVQHACNAPQPAWNISLQHRFWAPGRIGNLYSPNPGSARRVSPWSWFPWPRSSNQRLDAVPHVAHSVGGGGSAIPPSSGDSAYGFCAGEGEGDGGGGQGGGEGGAWGPPPPYSPAGRQGRHHVHPSPDPASTNLLHHHTHTHMDMHHAHTHTHSHLAHTHAPLACHRASSYNINQLMWEQQNLTLHGHLVPFTDCRMNESLGSQFDSSRYMGSSDGLDGMVVQPIVQDGDLITVNTAMLHRGGNDCLHRMVKEQGTGKEEYIDDPDAAMNDVRRIPPMTRPRDASTEGIGLEIIQGKENLAFQNDKHSPIRSSLELECHQQPHHHHQRSTSQPHHNAESEVYFADVSSCCNMSVKADCCGNSGLVGTHSLVGTIENHPESTSDSETGSFTLTRQQRPQPQTGSKRRNRLPSNENRNQNSVLELTQQNTSLLEDCLNRSSPGGQVRMSPLNGSLRRPSPIHRKTTHNNSSLSQSPYNSSLTQSQLNASLTQSQLNASSTQSQLNASLTQSQLSASLTQSQLNASLTQSQLSASLTQSQLNASLTQSQLNTNLTQSQLKPSLNQSDFNQSIINQRSLQQNIHNDNLNQRQLNRFKNASYNRNCLQNYEEPDSLIMNQNYHRRGSSDELNIASTHEYYVPTQQNVNAPLTPNTEESNLSEDETDRRFNEQRNVNESIRRRNICLDEGKTVTQMLNEQLNGGPLKSNHLRCYSDTNTMDSGWQSGSEKHVTD